MEIYKGYELFSDASYYDMICIRKKGSRDFNETIHVDTIQEAKETIDEMTTLYPDRQLVLRRPCDRLASMEVEAGLCGSKFIKT